MNELTIHGNVTDEPVLRYSPAGTAVVNFSVAVNQRRLDRRTGQWSDRAPVFHRVVAFNGLAENAAATLGKGNAVTVTGQLADDSWTGEDGRRHQRTVLEAADVAVSLRFATAQVTRVRREAQAADESAAEAPTAGR